LQSVDFIIVFVVVRLIKTILFTVFVYHVKVVHRVLVRWDGIQVLGGDKFVFFKTVPRMTSLCRTRSRLGSSLFLGRILYVISLFLASEVEALLIFTIILIVVFIKNNSVASRWLGYLRLSLCRLGLRRLRRLSLSRMNLLWMDLLSIMSLISRKDLLCKSRCGSLIS